MPEKLNLAETFSCCCLGPQSFETLNSWNHRLGKAFRPDLGQWGVQEGIINEISLILNALDGVFPHSFNGSGVVGRCLCGCCCAKCPMLLCQLLEVQVCMQLLLLCCSLPRRDFLWGGPQCASALAEGRGGTLVSCWLVFPKRCYAEPEKD